LFSVESFFDSAARKGVYHKNTAARTKSRLHKKLKLNKTD
jgi:ribosomal protein S20